VNRSEGLFSVHEGEILHALGAIRDVGTEAAKNVVALRKKHGAFKDIFSFAKVCSASGLHKKAVESLAASGVFDSIHPNRRQIFDHAPLLVGLGRKEQAGEAAGQSGLFGEEDAQTILPHCDNWNSEEKLANEFKAAGMYLSDHPLTPWQDKFETLGISPYLEFESHGKSTGRLAGVITAVQERRSRRGKPFAFLTLSDLSGAYEIVIFSELLRASRYFLETGTLVVAEVEADKDGESLRLRAQNLKKLDHNYRVSTSRKQMRLHLFVRDLNVLPQLKEALEANPGGTKVYLVLENNTEIVLPEGVVVNQGMMQQLNALGVEVKAA
jgi:DNA polymerase-3 subunit alpha